MSFVGVVMMNDKTKSRDLIKIVYRIRDFMKKNGKTVWSKEGVYGQFRFNKERSPDGALGFFLLVPKKSLTLLSNKKDLDSLTKGGKTISKNCQMLCKQDNRVKSGK